jgi:hypothetical protein
MMKHTITILTTLAALSGSVARAQDDDAMRCQARELRCDSEYYQCLSRCDRRDARVAALERPAAAEAGTDCEARCEQRHDAAMLRITTNPPCLLVKTPPDPISCEARLLRIQANRLVCESRCASGADPEACLARCTSRCDTAYDEAMMQGNCSAGRVGESPVCSDE